MNIHRVSDCGVVPAMCERQDSLTWRSGTKVEALRYSSGERAAVSDVEKDNRGGGQSWRILTASDGLKSDVDTLTDAGTDAAIAVSSIEGDDRVAVTRESEGQCERNAKASRNRGALSCERRICHVLMRVLRYNAPVQLRAVGAICALHSMMKRSE